SPFLTLPLHDALPIFIWRFQYSVVEVKVSTLWSVRCQMCHEERAIELSGRFVPCVRRNIPVNDCARSDPGPSTYLDPRKNRHIEDRKSTRLNSSHGSI